jgi:hypothetical protein
MIVVTLLRQAAVGIAGPADVCSAGNLAAVLSFVIGLLLRGSDRLKPWRAM